MFIKIYTFGKQKKSELLQLKERYMIMLSRWNVELIELKESKIGNVKNKQEADFKTFKKKLDPNYFPILMDERGNEFTSINLAEKLEKMNFEGLKIAFCLGGPFGFTEEDKHFFKEKIALSKLTMTHEMAEIILLEQLYRSFTILNNKDYHY